MSTAQYGRAWVELNLENLRHNVNALTALLPVGCALMPVLKANAYGHGAEPMAKALSRMGIQDFCVATAEEGAQLRRAGVTGVILILGYTHPSQIDIVRRYALTQTVVDYEYAKALNLGGAPLRVHLAVDTGMHRIGVPSEQMPELLKIFRMKHLNITGIFTHLCADDTMDASARDFTARQAARFQAVLRQLQAAGYTPKPHLLSSYGLINYPSLGGSFARVGIALYGVLSTEGDTKDCGVDLRPVLAVRARVASVRQLKQGCSAGYGLAFTARRDTLLATVTIGYGDGLPRALSCGVGSVLVNGKKAPVAGRICMDQTLVDVTDLPGVRPGTVVTVLGQDSAAFISAGEIAAQAGTISNEILSGLSQRLPRVCAAQALEMIPPASHQAAFSTHTA